MTELKSLGKIFKEKRCHLMGCNRLILKSLYPQSQRMNIQVQNISKNCFSDPTFDPLSTLVDKSTSLDSSLDSLATDITNLVQIRPSDETHHQSKSVGKPCQSGGGVVVGSGSGKENKVSGIRKGVPSEEGVKATSDFGQNYPTPRNATEPTTQV